MKTVPMSPISTLSLKMTYKSILKEVGDIDKIEPYDCNSGEFKTDEGWKIKVCLEKLPYEYYEELGIPEKLQNIKNVVYKIEGNQSQYSKSTYSVLIRVLKTVAEIVFKQFDIEKDIDGLIFFAANKDPFKTFSKTDPQKTSIYEAVLLSQMHKLGPGWSLRSLSLDDDYKGFMLYKN